MPFLAELEPAARHPEPGTNRAPLVWFDGYLHNTAELATELDRDNKTNPGELLLAGVRRWGPALWPRVRTSSFAVVCADTDTRDILLARDPAGSVGLYYAWDGGRLRISTQLSALAESLSSRPSVDPRQISRFFAFEAPEWGRTHFHGIREVPPGSVARVTDGEVREEPFWSPWTTPRLRLGNDREYQQTLDRELLRATARWIGGSDRVGIMLSGGLDSTSLAVAAGRLAPDLGLTVAACSWVFDQLRSCDERARIDDTVRAAALRVVRVKGDDAWPLADPEQFCNDPGNPVENPYRQLKNRLYRRSAEAGFSTLLNGGPADVLYRGGHQLFLRDLLFDRGPLAATRALAAQWRLAGMRRALGALARVVVPPPAQGLSAKPLAWLQPEARSPVAETTASVAGARHRVRGIRPYLDLERRGASAEGEYAARQGVRVVSPYLDPDLVEFFLALPAHQVYRPGTMKYATRRAMRGRAPQSVLDNQEPANLSPLFDRGLFEHRADLVHDLLHRPGSTWTEFVRPDFVAGIGPASPEIHKALLWRCLSFELWRQKHGWEIR